MRHNSKFETPSTRYIAAIALAVVAQAVPILMHASADTPFIAYAPFIVLSALACGLGPGLLTTTLCSLEAVHFTLAVSDRQNWLPFGALVLTGLVASVLVERLKRTTGQLAEAYRKTTAILEGISDGFHTLDHQWRCTYVNAAAAKMFGKPPEELRGKNLWEIWPQVADSPFGAAYRRAVAENVPVAIEAFYPEPLNAWFEVRCYPSAEGLTLFFTDNTERKRVDERLRLLEAAILQTSDEVLILNISGGEACCREPVFINPAFERMTGFNLEDLRQVGLPFLCPRPNPNSLEQPLDGSAKICPKHSEQLVVRKDGSEFWAELDFRPLEGKDGNYTHCVWTCRDINERREAQEKAMLLSSIVECSDDAIIGKNLNGIVLTWNKGAERIYGYTSAEIVGRSISILIPPDRDHELLFLLDNLRRGAKIEHYETERVRKDGRRIVMSLTVSPIENTAGDIVGGSITARDITERKRAEAAVQLSEERYRALTFVTSQIVWTTNPAGEVEDMPMWRAFTGQSLDEVRGWGWIQALHPEDRDRTADIWSRSVRNHSFYDTEFRMRRHDGEYRWMAVHGVPVLEEKGTIREWVGTCADISERKQAEEEIRRLNQDLERRVVERTAQWEASSKELEAFAYSVSHDLRAPLRAIDGFSRILLEEHAAQLPEEAHHYLDVVRANAVQMGNLIDDLLAFSRLSRQPLRKRTVDLENLVRQALEQLAVDREGRQVEVAIGQLPGSEADPALLKQVFLNLLSNALKYSKPRNPARIEVGALMHGEAETAPADPAVYYVRDNGVGFDMRYVEKLFGVFQRLHRAEDFEGTGVGLAIVHRIISRHGGRVWADAAVDRGATFYFTLAGAETTSGPGSKSWPMST